MSRIMHFFNTPVLFILCLGGFLWLAHYSHTQTRTESDKMASKAEVDAFIAKQLSEYNHPRKLTQAAALAEVWNLTQSDIAKPVDLFGGEGL